MKITKIWLIIALAALIVCGVLAVNVYAGRVSGTETAAVSVSEGMTLHVDTALRSGTVRFQVTNAAQTAVEDYLGRFPRDFTVSVKEIKAEPRTGGKPVAQVMALEAERIERAVPAGDIVVAMDEHGRDMTTVDFAKKIVGWKNEGSNVTFVIGGADGLDPALKSKARMMLRLSSMTLPHAFARVLLTEQIYRAWSLLVNHPYHRV